MRTDCEAKFEPHKWKLLTSELDMWAEYDTIHATRTYLYCCENCTKLWDTKAIEKELK